jgi:hypothetical protein
VHSQCSLELCFCNTILKEVSGFYICLFGKATFGTFCIGKLILLLYGAILDSQPEDLVPLGTDVSHVAASGRRAVGVACYYKTKTHCTTRTNFWLPVKRC